MVLIFIWLQVANLIWENVIFFAVPRQATLELSGRFCPDQDIFFKKIVLTGYIQYSLRAGLNGAKQNRDTKSRFNERNQASI
jgi:hypothetical protein